MSRVERNGSIVKEKEPAGIGIISDSIDRFSSISYDPDRPGRINILSDTLYDPDIRFTVNGTDSEHPITPLFFEMSASYFLRRPPISVSR